jgi:ribonuclease HII
MLVYAGIDEAGYGPILGPLCVGAAVLRMEGVDPEDGPPNVWQVLRTAVCRGARDAKKRIAINDSKKLKGSNTARLHPLTHLERGVLAFLGDAVRDLDDDDGLFRLLGVNIPSCRWYGDPQPIPTAHDAAALRIAAARLARCMSRLGVSVELMRCEAVDVRELNESIERHGQKAAINFEAAMRLADEIWRSCEADHPRLMIDRHGGRTHYREPLQMMWPDALITVLAETDRVSRYRLERRLAGGERRRMTVSFEPAADGGHFPVALASMTAKYVRELFMARLNAYFEREMPELKPTAGYFKDGRRWIEEVTEVIRRLEIDERELVRRL